jgi:hypothetical protein
MDLEARVGGVGRGLEGGMGLEEGVAVEEEGEMCLEEVVAVEEEGEMDLEERVAGSVELERQGHKESVGLVVSLGMGDLRGWRYPCRMARLEEKTLRVETAEAREEG